MPRFIKPAVAFLSVSLLALSHHAAKAEIRSGPRIGVRAGWVERSGPAGFQPPSGGVGAGVRGLESTKSRVEPRLFAGYDIPLTRGLVVGAEAEIGPAGGTRVVRINGVARGATRSEQSYAISARVGAPISDNTLIYLRAGYAAERLHATYLGPTIRIFPPPKTESTSWAGGTSTGIGLERTLSKHVSLQAEYQRRFMSHGYRVQAVTIGAAWLF